MKNKKSTNLFNYFLLMLVALFSFLVIRNFDFFAINDSDSWMGENVFYFPGELFSLFLFFLHFKKKSFLKSILYLLLLIAFYILAFSLSIATWGIFVPFVGGLGALLIKKLYIVSTKTLDDIGISYLTYGFIAGLIGLILFFTTQDFFTAGEGFGFIIVIWQLVIGVKCIKQTKNENNQIFGSIIN